MAKFRVITRAGRFYVQKRYWFLWPYWEFFLWDDPDMPSSFATPSEARIAVDTALANIGEDVVMEWSR
jgi:hypothetical protein